MGDWAFTIDLEDAYFHISVQKEHRKFLRFIFQGVHYQYRVLPFGLAIAPRIFTKIMAAVGGFLRFNRIEIFMYLDDWLIKNQSRQALLEQKRLILKTLEALGLLINKEKSVLEPTQKIEYLGATINLQKGVIYPSQQKFLEIEKQINSLQGVSAIGAREFLRLLGLMTACIDLVPRARIQTRPIQFHLMNHWKAETDPLEKSVPVTNELLQHLQWWSQEETFFRGVPLKFTKDKVLWTDASEQGWGAHLDSFKTQGLWDDTQKKRHINWLELKAVQLALVAFCRHVTGKRVLIRSDNSTVVAYINKEGGTRSLPLCQLMWELLLWADSFQIELRAAHIPGKKNILADRLSRNQRGPRLTEWTLDKAVVKQIFRVFGEPCVDLFATEENKQLPIFCSPWPTEGAWHSDALSVDWTGIYAYAFPPQTLLHRVLQKVIREKCTIILIAPRTPYQSWYPVLLNLLIEAPRSLPMKADLLTQNRGRWIHPNPMELKLTAWKISGMKEEQNAFLRRQETISHRVVGRRQGGCMRPDRDCSVVGVREGRYIHALPL